MSEKGRHAVAALVVFLAGFGILAAFLRVADVLEHPPGESLSSVARTQIALTADVMGVRAETPERRELERRSAQAIAKFHEHRGATLLHMVAGSLVLVLALLQFSPPVRARWPAVHRWTGRVILVMVLGAAASGIFFSVVAPLGGLAETSAVLVFGVFFVLAASRGWIAIRHGRRVVHREWMIRMFAVALGIAVMRMGLLAAIVILDLGLEAFEPGVFGASLWIGWLVALAGAEIYIRSTRASSLPMTMHDSSVLRT